MMETQELDVAIALKNFRFAEEELYKALDELENTYYAMKDDDPNMNYVLQYLQQYEVIPRDITDIESELVKEYEIAKEENVNEDQMNKIYNKMNVANRRIFDNSKGGILYVILKDEKYL